MPHCLLPSCLPSGFLEVVPVIAVTVPEAIEFISRHSLIAVLVAGGVGLLIGWLSKQSAVGETAGGDSDPVTPGFPEMKWRHEKLVLTERQQAEKQTRLDEFADRCGRYTTAGEHTVAVRVFVLGERLREARQKVGSDLSRMKAVRDRLDEISAPMERGREVVGACRGMAEAQAMRLDEAREALRGIAEEVHRIEEAVSEGGIDLGDTADLRRELMDLKGEVLSLPHGWATAGEETDRRIRELLASVDDAALTPVREVLLVDGALTASLAGASSIDLPGAVVAVIASIDRATRIQGDDEGKVEEKVSTRASLLSGLPEPLSEGASAAAEDLNFGFPDPGTPDPAFRDPLEFMRPAPRAATGFHDLTDGGGEKLSGEPSAPPAPIADLKVEELPVEVDCPHSERSLVLFCSNDVELWGKTVYRGARCRAKAIHEFPAWAKWISIRRLDTHERVFAPVRTANLRTGQTADPFGFNGTNELFYGARHLGLFSESCPNEVETRFTYGGWGFGHRAHEIAPEVEQLQAAGWEGREIPADTVFEIVIHEELPALGKLDRLLENEVVGKP